MNGNILQLLEFFDLVGRVEKTENYSDDIESQYIIKLTPDYSEISVFDLKTLETLVSPNRVKIWFFYNSETEENECNIEIQILRSMPV